MKTRRTLFIVSVVVAALVLSAAFTYFVIYRLLGNMGSCSFTIDVQAVIPENVQFESGDSLVVTSFSELSIGFTSEGIPMDSCGKDKEMFSGFSYAAVAGQREYIVNRSVGSSEDNWVLVYLDKNRNNYLDKGELYGVSGPWPINFECLSPVEEKTKKVRVVLDRIRMRDD